MLLKAHARQAYQGSVLSVSHIRRQLPGHKVQVNALAGHPPKHTDSASSDTLGCLFEGQMPAYRKASRCIQS